MVAKMLYCTVCNDFMLWEVYMPNFKGVGFKGGLGQYMENSGIPYLLPSDSLSLGHGTLEGINEKHIIITYQLTATKKSSHP